MTNPARQLLLIGFLQAQNCSNYPGSWRHRDAAADFLTPAYYQRVARTLEAGKFQMAFFDDRLAIPDRYGDDFVETVRHGVRAVKLDPIPLITAMGLATERLGLGATYSTTYYEPFHVARVFATLDQLTAGRAAWNVVTSLNDSEAANFSQDAHLGHDARYDRADEFMHVVLGHWDTWEPDAIVLNRAAELFADPAKVHRLNHEGAWFQSRGPFTVPPSAQGRPVVIQAGQSGRGLEFAARWAELVFAINPTLEYARRSYRAMKDAIVAAGREPDSVAIAPAAFVVVAETQAEADEKAAYIRSLHRPIDTLALISEVLNYDFAARDLDAPFSDEELAAIGGLRAIADRVITISGNPHPTTRDFVEHSGRGTIDELALFVGTPQTVADGMEEWFRTPACDGFVIAATHVPGSHEDFVRLVVPELQRRGLHQTEYRGATLRENLGLPVARRGDWKR